MHPYIKLASYFASSLVDVVVFLLAYVTFCTSFKLYNIYRGRYKTSNVCVEGFEPSRSLRASRFQSECSDQTELHADSIWWRMRESNSHEELSKLPLHQSPNESQLFIFSRICSNVIVFLLYFLTLSECIMIVQFAGWEIIFGEIPFETMCIYVKATALPLSCCLDFPLHDSHHNEGTRILKTRHHVSLT